MIDWHAGGVLQAAFRAFINDRCRPAYVHDMRGGLQALYSSFELLTQAAKQGRHNAALIDTAASIAKRAMANHEQSVIDIVNQVTGSDDVPMALNLAELVKQVQRFLRNDAFSKGLTLVTSGRDDLCVVSERNTLRSLILGLMILGIDGLPWGSKLHVDLSCTEGFAVMELRSALIYQPIRDAEELLCRQSVNPTPQELVLGFARQWIVAKGGRLEILPQTGAQTGLRIYYPLAAR